MRLQIGQELGVLGHANILDSGISGHQRISVEICVWFLTRTVGTAAFTALTINPTEWKDANWAREKGLYADVFSSVEELDKAVQALAEKLSQSSPEAMAQLKKVMWEGTENWDTLLIERAEMSGRLVLSEFTRNYIEKFKAGAKK